MTGQRRGAASATLRVDDLRAEAVGADGVRDGAKGAASGAVASRSAATRLRRWTPGRWLKPVVFILALLPFAALVKGLFDGGLGPNPVEALTDHTGTLAIRFLLIGLAVTPLRWWLKNTWPLRLRRMLGLFAFFYAALHVAIYAVLDRELDVALLVEDLVERPYVMAGFAAFVVLVPLTATSTKGIARRLGRRWQSLHRWVYIAATAAVVHYVWLAKGDLIEPFVYLAVLFVLLAWRLSRMMSEGSRAR